MNADRRAMLLALALAVVPAVAGCADGGPPRIHAGTDCARCGMAASDPSFACERKAAGKWRVYDSIECLLGDGGTASDAYLADYDSHALHAADSMWVVRGDFPSPMGGGYAAFLDRAAADDIAARTSGRVARLAGFAGPAAAAGGAR